MFLFLLASRVGSSVQRVESGRKKVICFQLCAVMDLANTVSIRDVIPRFHRGFLGLEITRFLNTRMIPTSLFMLNILKCLWKLIMTTLCNWLEIIR
jgi:hypothetical protein